MDEDSNYDIPQPRPRLRSPTMDQTENPTQDKTEQYEYETSSSLTHATDFTGVTLANEKSNKIPILNSRIDTSFETSHNPKINITDVTNSHDTIKINNNLEEASRNMQHNVNLVSSNNNSGQSSTRNSQGSVNYKVKRANIIQANNAAAGRLTSNPQINKTNDSPKSKHSSKSLTSIRDKSKTSILSQEDHDLLMDTVTKCLQTSKSDKILNDTLGLDHATVNMDENQSELDSLESLNKTTIDRKSYKRISRATSHRSAGKISRASSMRGSFRTKYPLNYERSKEEIQFDYMKYVLSGFCFILFTLSILYLVLSFMNFTFDTKENYDSLITLNSIPMLNLCIKLTSILTIILSTICLIGLYKENEKYFKLSLIILLIILIIDFYGVITGHLFYSKLQDRDMIYNNLEHTFNEIYDNDTNNQISIDINKLQSNEKCCGISYYYSWLNSKWRQNELIQSSTSSLTESNTQRHNRSPNIWKNTTPRKVPDSCCIYKKPYCGRNTSKNNIYRESRYNSGGCLDKLLNNFKERYYYNIKLMDLITVLHFLMMSLTAFMIFRIKDFEYID